MGEVLLGKFILGLFSQEKLLYAGRNVTEIVLFKTCSKKILCFDFMLMHVISLNAIFLKFSIKYGQLDCFIG